jgi:hypothetical protein
VLLLAAVEPTRGDEPLPPDVLLVVPLHLHILRADNLPEIDCTLTEADLNRILSKVNQIWQPARIQFRAASRHVEQAAGLEAFRSLRQLLGESDPPLPRYRPLIPRDSFTDDGLHVYYVHRLPVNGVYLGGRQAMVQDSASLRPVDGGIDEPLPRVTAHEIGHALGLAHRPDRTHLMASGTTGTRLIDSEIATARARAATIPGTTRADKSPPPINAADQNGEADHAGGIDSTTHLPHNPGSPSDSN